MADRQLKLSNDSAKEQVIAQGYDPAYGARPLKRLIRLRGNRCCPLYQRMIRIPNGSEVDFNGNDLYIKVDRAKGSGGFGL